MVHQLERAVLNYQAPSKLGAGNRGPSRLSWDSAHHLAKGSMTGDLKREKRSAVVLVVVVVLCLLTLVARGGGGGGGGALVLAGGAGFCGEGCEGWIQEEEEEEGTQKEEEEEEVLAVDARVGGRSLEVRHVAGA
ncbi:hypothetical protein B0T13DRAFT_450537 [Neurospora crassa]|nr:hypothetical protein B0T13DRAFT_450537 [Neurospora crassa]